MRFRMDEYTSDANPRAQPELRAFDSPEFEPRDPQRGHSMHGQDSALFTETLVE